MNNTDMNIMLSTQNTEPLVSIVVPIYNAEMFLARCVESLLSQSYDSTEIILVNDGSADESANICRRYSRKSKKVKIINQPNKGVSSARNHGIKRATGKYLVFVDADDTMDSDGIEKLVYTIEQYRADIVSAPIKYITKNAQKTKHNDSNMIEPLVAKGSEIVSNYFSIRAGVSACSRIYRRAKFESILFNENIAVNEDKLFVYMCFAHSLSHVSIFESVYNYHQVESSVSHQSFSEKYFDIETVADQIYNDAIKKFPNLSIAAENYRTLSLMELYASISISRTARRKYDVQYKELRKKIIASKSKSFDDPKATIRLFIIRYFPSLFTPIAICYDWVYLNRKRL
jgi:glycosyltransferase involved in cell wall biosynthesis